MRQTFKNAFEIKVRIVPVELGRLDEAHHVGSALAGAERSGEEPVRSA
jgi:hypothetical protein